MNFLNGFFGNRDREGCDCCTIIILLILLSCLCGDNDGGFLNGFMGGNCCDIIIWLVLLSCLCGGNNGCGNRC